MHNFTVLCDTVVIHNLGENLSSIKNGTPMTDSLLYAKVLIVDDERAITELLQEVYESEQCLVETASNGSEALDKLSSFHPHMILLDIKMPIMNGVEALKAIQTRSPETEVIMVTAVNDINLAEECMHNGAYGYVVKPVDLDKLLNESRDALNHRKKEKEKQKLLSEEEREKLQLALQNKILNTELFNALKFPFSVLEFKDPEFVGHSRSVAHLTEKLALVLKTSNSRLCYLAGLYHDFGKLNLPTHLRGHGLKNNDPEDRALFNSFPFHSHQMVQPHVHLRGLGAALLHQCENWDGSGFPDGLRKHEIPIESRLIAVANAWDEERNRMNQSGSSGLWREEEACKLVRLHEGEKFDPSVIEALEVVLKDPEFLVTAEEISISDLRPKMILAENLCTRSGQLIASSDQALSAQKISEIFERHKTDPIVTPIRISRSR